jgi:hypothetical protein
MWLGFFVARVVREMPNQSGLCKKRHGALASIVFQEGAVEPAQHFQTIDRLLARRLVVPLGVGGPIADTGKVLNDLGMFI